MLPQNNNNNDEDEMQTTSSKSQTDKPLKVTLQKDTNRLWKDISPYSQLFLNISWVVSLVLACEDSSLCANDLHPHTYMTYRQWLMIDGWTTLAFLFLTLLSNIFSLCSGGCRKGWRCVLVVAFIFKAGWIVMGAYMFVSCDFDRCNELLLEFSICYFLGFVYIVGRCLGVGSRLCGRGLRKCLKGKAKKEGEQGEGEEGKERVELPKTPRKIKVEVFDGVMEQENSSALVYNIEDEEGTH